MHRKKRLVLKSIATALCIVFVSSELRAAPMESPQNITAQEAMLNHPQLFEAPIDFASLSDLHAGRNGKFIIHIQDAHSNFSAQDNLASAMRDLMTKYDVQLVLSEGGYGDCTLSELRDKAKPELVKRVARSFLHSGEIHGEEYLNLTDKRPMKITGIEDKALYEEGLKYYEELADKREKVLGYLVRSRNAIEKLKSKLYPKELVDYERAGLARQNTDWNVEEFLKLAVKRDLDLSAYAELIKLSDIKRSEEAIDFESANLEQSVLIEELFKKGAKETLESYLAKMKQMKGQSSGGKVSQFTYFEKTLSIAKEKGVETSKFPNFLAYMEYLRKFSALNFDALLREFDRAEDELYKKILSVHSPQSTVNGNPGTQDDAFLLRAVDRFILLLQTAHQIQMTADQFALFKYNEPDFSTEAMQAFLNRKLAEQGYFEDIIPYEPLLEDARKTLDQFYDSVKRRDAVFMENLGKAMGVRSQEFGVRSEEKIAFLIAGGYHTPHLKEMLRKEGYGYAVLAPIVTTETNQKKYESLLLNKNDKAKKKVHVVSGESKASEKPLGALDDDLAKLIKKKDKMRTPMTAVNPITGARLAEALGVPAYSVQRSADRAPQSHASPVASNILRTPNTELQTKSGARLSSGANAIAGDYEGELEDIIARAKRIMYGGAQQRVDKAAGTIRMLSHADFEVTLVDPKPGQNIPSVAWVELAVKANDRPKIFILRDLVDILDDAELLAVIGHEVAHHMNRDYQFRQNIVRSRKKYSQELVDVIYMHQEIEADKGAIEFLRRSGAGDESSVISMLEKAFALSRGQHIYTVETHKDDMRLKILRNRQTQGEGISEVVFPLNVAGRMIAAGFRYAPGDALEDSPRRADDIMMLTEMIVGGMDFIFKVLSDGDQAERSMQNRFDKKLKDWGWSDPNKASQNSQDRKRLLEIGVEIALVRHLKDYYANGPPDSTESKYHRDLLDAYEEKFEALLDSMLYEMRQAGTTRFGVDIEFPVEFFMESIRSVARVQTVTRTLMPTNKEIDEWMKKWLQKPFSPDLEPLKKFYEIKYDGSYTSQKRDSDLKFLPAPQTDPFAEMRRRFLPDVADRKIDPAKIIRIPDIADEFINLRSIEPILIVNEHLQEIFLKKSRWQRAKEFLVALRIIFMILPILVPYQHTRIVQRPVTHLMTTVFGRATVYDPYKSPQTGVTKEGLRFSLSGEKHAIRIEEDGELSLQEGGIVAVDPLVFDLGSDLNIELADGRVVRYLVSDIGGKVRRDMVNLSMGDVSRPSLAKFERLFEGAKVTGTKDGASHSFVVTFDRRRVGETRVSEVLGFQAESVRETEWLFLPIPLLLLRKRKEEDPSQISGARLSSGITRWFQDRRIRLGYLKAGDQVGPYTILRLVRQGGMGAVYEAVDSQGKHFAFKTDVLVRPFLSFDPLYEAGRFTRKKNLENEIYWLQQLNAYTKTGAEKSYFPVFVSSGNLSPVASYMVTEFISDPTLRDVMRDRARQNAGIARMDIERAVKITVDLLDALTVAHRVGVVHNDIKPDNVFVTEDGDGPHVRLHDFGIATQRSFEAELMKVPAAWNYATPEILEGLAPGVASDVYQAGLLLYELVYGVSAYTTREESFKEKDSYDKLISDSLLPPGVKEVLLRALKRDPQERYQSASEMKNALQNALSTSFTIEDFDVEEMGLTQDGLYLDPKDTRSKWITAQDSTPVPIRVIRPYLYRHKQNGNIYFSYRREPLDAPAHLRDPQEEIDRKLKLEPEIYKYAERVGIRNIVQTVKSDNEVLTRVAQSYLDEEMMSRGTRLEDLLISTIYFVNHDASLPGPDRGIEEPQNVYARRINGRDHYLAFDMVGSDAPQGLSRSLTQDEIMDFADALLYENPPIDRAYLDSRINALSLDVAQRGFLRDAINAVLGQAGARPADSQAGGDSSAGARLSLATQREVSPIRKLKDYSQISEIILLSAYGDIYLRLKEFEEGEYDGDASRSWTMAHEQRVTENAVRIGQELGLSESELLDLAFAAAVHDIGKTKTPASILNSPTALMADQEVIMRKHVMNGVRILGDHGVGGPIIRIVSEHHELLNGKGYPIGLKGDQISRLGQILTVADVFTALTEIRGYRTPRVYTTTEALEKIIAGKGNLYAADVVEALERVVARTNTFAKGARLADTPRAERARVDFSNIQRWLGQAQNRYISWPTGAPENEVVHSELKVDQIYDNSVQFVLVRAYPSQDESRQNLDFLSHFSPDANFKGNEWIPTPDSFGQIMLQQYQMPDGAPFILIREVQPSSSYYRVARNQRKKIDAWRAATIQKIVDWAEHQDLMIYASSPEVIKDHSPFRIDGNKLDPLTLKRNYQDPYDEQVWGKEELTIPTFYESSRKPLLWYAFNKNQSIREKAQGARLAKKAKAQKLPTGEGREREIDRLTLELAKLRAKWEELDTKSLSVQQLEVSEAIGEVQARLKLLEKKAGARLANIKIVLTPGAAQTVERTVKISRRWFFRGLAVAVVGGAGAYALGSLLGPDASERTEDVSLDEADLEDFEKQALSADLSGLDEDAIDHESLKRMVQHYKGMVEFLRVSEAILYPDVSEKERAQRIAHLSFAALFLTFLENPTFKPVQMAGGPAAGPFQIEPQTAADVFREAENKPTGHPVHGLIADIVNGQLGDFHSLIRASKFNKLSPDEADGIRDSIASSLPLQRVLWRLFILSRMEPSAQDVQGDPGQKDGWPEIHLGYNTPYEMRTARPRNDGEADVPLRRGLATRFKAVAAKTLVARLLADPSRLDTPEFEYVYVGLLQDYYQVENINKYLTRVLRMVRNAESLLDNTKKKIQRRLTGAQKRNSSRVVNAQIRRLNAEGEIRGAQEALSKMRIYQPKQYTKDDEWKELIGEAQTAVDEVVQAKARVKNGLERLVPSLATPVRRRSGARLAMAPVGIELRLVAGYLPLPLSWKLSILEAAIGEFERQRTPTLEFYERIYDFMASDAALVAYLNAPSAGKAGVSTFEERMPLFAKVVGQMTMEASAIQQMIRHHERIGYVLRRDLTGESWILQRVNRFGSVMGFVRFRFDAESVALYIENKYVHPRYRNQHVYQDLMAVLLEDKPIRIYESLDETSLSWLYDSLPAEVKNVRYPTAHSLTQRFKQGSTAYNTAIARLVLAAMKKPAGSSAVEALMQDAEEESHTARRDGRDLTTIGRDFIPAGKPILRYPDVEYRIRLYPDHGNVWMEARDVTQVQPGLFDRVIADTAEFEMWVSQRSDLQLQPAEVDIFKFYYEKTGELPLDAWVRRAVSDLRAGVVSSSEISVFIESLPPLAQVQDDVLASYENYISEGIHIAFLQAGLEPDLNGYAAIEAAYQNSKTVSGTLSEMHAYWVSEIVRLGLLSESDALKWFDSVRKMGSDIDSQILDKKQALVRAEYGSKELKKGLEKELEALRSSKDGYIWDAIRALREADPAVDREISEQPYDAIPLVAVSVSNVDSPLHNAFYVALRERSQDSKLWTRFFSSTNYSRNSAQRSVDATFFSASLMHIMEQKSGARLASQANEEVDRFRNKIHHDISSLAALTLAVEGILNRIWEQIGLDHPNIVFSDADLEVLRDLRSKLLQYHPLVVFSLRVMPQDRIATFNFVDLKYINTKIGIIANDLIIAKRHVLIRAAMQRHHLIGADDESLFDTYKQDKYVISRATAERLGVKGIESALGLVRQEVLSELSDFAMSIYAEQLGGYEFKMFVGVSAPVSSNEDESKIYADLQSGQSAKEARRVFENNEVSSGVFIYDTFGSQEANALIEARAEEAADLRAQLGLSNTITGDTFDMPTDQEMMEVRGKSETQIRAMGDSRKTALKKYLDLIDYFDYPKGWIDEEITQRNKHNIINTISDQISRAIQNRAPPLSPEQFPAVDPDTSFTLLMRQALSFLRTNLKQSNITSETVFHAESMRRKGIFISYDAADFYTNTMRQMAKAHLRYLNDQRRTPMSLLDHVLAADDNVKKMMIDKTAYLIRIVNKGDDARLKIPTLPVVGLQRPRAKNRAYLATREGGDEAGVFVEFKEGDITEKELESWLSNLVRDGRALNGRLTVSERWDGQSKNYASVVAETVHPYSERYVAAQAAELYLKRLMVQSGSVSKTALIQVLENNQGAPTKWKFFYTGADGAVQIETQTYEDLIKGSRLSLKTDGRIYQEWIGSNPVLAAAILKADALIDTDQQIMVELDVLGQVEGKPKPYVHILQYQGLITNLVLGPTNAEDRSEALRGPVAEKLIRSIFSWLKAKGFDRLQLALLSDRIENSKKFFNSTLAPFAEAEDAYLFQNIGGTTYLVADLSKFDFSAGGRLSSNAVRRGIPTAARKAFALYLNDPYDAIHLLRDDLIAINGMPGLRDGAGITQEQFFDMAMQRKVSVKSALTRLKQGHGSVVALPIAQRDLISLIDSPVERNLEFYKKGEQMILIVSPGQPTTDHDFAYGLDMGGNGGAAFNSPFLKFIHIDGHSHPRYSTSNPSEDDLEGDAGKLSEFSFGSLIVTKIDAETIDLEHRRPEGRDYKNYRGEAAVVQLATLGILKSTENTGARLADTIESVQSLTIAETEKIRRTLVPDSFYQKHWMKAAEVPWVEVVRDPAKEPQPNTQNQENYWINQHEIRLEFLRYLASSQNEGALSEDGFSKLLMKMNKTLLLGSDGDRLYITPTSSPRSLEDGYGDNAGKLRGDNAATDIFRAFTIYAKLKQDKATQSEIIHAIAAIYRSAIITYLQPLYRGNNSLAMNIVNALLRLEGLNGISHGRFDQIGREEQFESDFLAAIKLANPGFELLDGAYGARLAESETADQRQQTVDSAAALSPVSSENQRSLFLNGARLSSEHILNEAQVDAGSLTLLAQAYQNRGRLAGSVFHFGISESRFATVQFAPGGFAAVSLVGLPGAPMIELPAPDNVLAPKMREAESTASIIVKTAINDNASIARTGFRVLTSLGERPVLIVRPVSGVEEALQIKETLDVIGKRLPQVYFEFYDANSSARLAQISSAAGSIPAEAQIVYLAEANEVNLRSALDRKARFVSTEPIDQKNGDMAFMPLTASLTAAAVVGRLDSIQGQDLAAQFFRRLTKATFGQAQYQFYIKPSMETLPDLAFNSIKALARLEIAQVLAGARMALQAIAQAA